MIQLSIEDAQSKLAELIGGMAPGEEIEIVRNDGKTAKLIMEHRHERRQFGLGKGKPTIHQEDDDHLADFAAYMP